MNTKKTLLAFAAIATLALSSCTSTNAEDDATYNDLQAIEKSRITKVPAAG
ncbi:peptidase m28 [Cellulophaga baltica]|uniref:peptidase m28 n=1 Tax=Cellulophaga TaxID=104264 RepID=UPI001C07393E|nr:MULTISPECIES: peptidase m28 [Cellulophaga]MBU2996191.1 peptidase m28 [Cellulophaga baltica]MDO6767586.1 peptidase m28 [Cellulophaga sp. 1_MG-2023]